MATKANTEKASASGRRKLLQKAVTDDSVSVTVMGFEPVTVKLDELSAEMVRRAAVHGLSQKLGDACAVGADGTPADAYERLTATAKAVREGQWTIRKPSDGPSGGKVARALVAAQAAAGRELALERAIEIVRQQGWRKVLANQAVAEQYARLQAAEAEAAPSLDDLA